MISVGSIELLSQNNDNLEKYGFWLNQAFTSGELYINSMLDTLICQAFYNPFIVNIIGQLILGESAFKFSEETTNILNREKLLKSSLNLLKVKELLEKYKYENLEDIIETNKISFKMLFEFLIDKNKVPIGILRNCEQGFVTENGYFVDRKIALHIAEYFNQIDSKYFPKNILMSEDLKTEDKKILKYIKEYTYKKDNE